MNDEEIETYFLWLTEAEQSDLFDYEDTSLICESVMEQHSSLAPDYDYSEKPSSDYPSNETLHIPNMNPEPTTVATTFSYNQEIIPNNLYYSASGINHPYQTINENSAEFDPIYYENTSKNVEPIHQYSVQNSVLDSSSLVPSTIDYIETNAAPVVEYNDVSSLPNEMEHVPPNYTVSNTMQEPCMNVTDNAPSEQLHIASVLLDVPLEQLSNDAVPLQQEVHNESIDFSGVAQEVPTIPDDTSIHFQHESLDNLDGCSNIPGGFEPTADSSEYHDDSSRSMIIDEEPQLSVNYEVEDQTVPENVDISNCEYSESESHPTTEVADEVTTAENQADDTKEVISTVSVVEEPTVIEEDSKSEEVEPPSRVEAEEEDTKVTSQINGTTDEVDSEIVTAVQMCIRTGCANPAVENPEWEQEFCSNDCVVLHCRNVFDAWVAANVVLSQ